MVALKWNFLNGIGVLREPRYLVGMHKGFKLSDLKLCLLTEQYDCLDERSRIRFVLPVWGCFSAHLALGLGRTCRAFIFMMPPVLPGFSDPRCLL